MGAPIIKGGRTRTDVTVPDVARGSELAERISLLAAGEKSGVKEAVGPGGLPTVADLLGGQFDAGDVYTGTPGMQEALKLINHRPEQKRITYEDFADPTGESLSVSTVPLSSGRVMIRLVQNLFGINWPVLTFFKEALEEVIDRFPMGPMSIPVVDVTEQTTGPAITLDEPSEIPLEGDKPETLELNRKRNHNISPTWRVLTKPEIAEIEKEMEGLRKSGDEGALAEALFKNGCALIEGSTLTSQGETYIKEAIGIFDRLENFERSGDASVMLYEYYGTIMKNKKSLALNVLTEAAEWYDKAGVEKKALDAWKKVGRLCLSLAAEKRALKIYRNYKMAATAFANARDLEARNNVAFKQGLAALNDAKGMVGAMVPGDYVDGNTNLAQLLDILESARDGFAVASSGGKKIAVDVRAHEIELVTLSVDIWTQMLSVNSPLIYESTLYLKTGINFETLRPEFGPMKMYPMAISGLDKDIETAKGLGAYAVAKKAETERKKALADYKKLINAVISSAKKEYSESELTLNNGAKSPSDEARARAGLGKVIKFCDYAIQMSTAVMMNKGTAKAKELKREAERLLELASRDMLRRKTKVDKETDPEKIIKMSAKIYDFKKKYPVLERAADILRDKGEVDRAKALYEQIYGGMENRDFSFESRLRVVSKIAEIVKESGDLAGYKEKSREIAGVYRKWAEMSKKSNLAETIKSAVEWDIKGEDYDRAVTDLLRAAEVEFAAGRADTFKQAIATKEDKKHNSRNLTILGDSLVALRTSQTALKLARAESRDPQIINRAERMFQLRLRELHSMAREVIGTFGPVSRRYADNGMPAVLNDSRPALYVQAVDILPEVASLADSVEMSDKLLYDPDEMYNREKDTAERLRAKLDRSSTGSP